MIMTINMTLGSESREVGLIGIVVLYLNNPIQSTFF